ncbi:MAG: sporulation integral membrane protein YtvI [Erysipelotrichaceae bacterium]|nr:sporulation integral membrane protein YtvI [Erysipelotrichaceae bacterium]
MKNSNYKNDSALYKRVGLRVVLAIISFLLLIFVFPKLISILLPFVVAFVVATILNPFVNEMTKKGKISRRAIAAFLSVTVFMIVVLLLGLVIYGIGKESISLATAIQQNWDEIIGTLGNIEGNLREQFGFLPVQVIEALTNLEESILKFVQNVSKNILNIVITVTTTVTGKTGTFLVNFIITVLGSYFIIVEYDAIINFMKKHVGNRISEFIVLIKQSILSALGGYIKSQLILAFFAFIFMLIPLAIYRQPYALLISLFLGFIDLLPIVGTISVLVPWGVVLLISGNISKGVFIIVLGVVFFIVRKIIEPKVVGSQTGLHPLAALISTYIGLKISGVLGAIMGPMILMLFTSIIKSGIFDNTISDIKTVIGNVSKILHSNEKST